MSIHQTYTFHIRWCQITFLTCSDGSTHRKFLLICEKNCLPQFVFVCHIIMIKKLGGTASQRVKGFTCSTRLNSLVTAVDFGPRFLHQKNPDLIRRWSSWKSPSLLMRTIWKSIVHYNSAFLTTNVKLDSVASSFVNFLSLENSLNSFWVLG